MKKIILFTVAFCISLSLLAQTNAEQSNPSKKEVKRTIVTAPGPVMRQGFINMQESAIPGLSEEQRESIKQLRLTMAKEVRKHTNLLREKKAHLTTLQDEDKPDQKAIYKTIDEITTLEGQIMKARADFRMKVNALLNEEQRIIFQQLNNQKHFEFRQDNNEPTTGNFRVFSQRLAGGEGKNIRVFNSEGEEIGDWKALKKEGMKVTRIEKDEDGEAKIYIETK